MTADRHTLLLSKETLTRAIQGVRAAAAKGGWVLELRPRKRTDEQNDALHGLIAQIMAQRPIHNGIKMDMALWKATFMHALGEEIRFVPALDGDGVFPLGLRTSALSKERFSDLIELILAWCVREGITVRHFDTLSTAEAGGSGSNVNPRREAA